MYEKIREEYPYLYETHLHTSQASACARSTGAEMARACKEYGYTGIFVTDHNWGGNTTIDARLDWNAWVDQFSLGYEQSRQEGERIGLDVFFGYEAGYDGTEFLLYGIDKVADHHPVIFGRRPDNQAFMAVVEISHGRHQPHCQALPPPLLYLFPYFIYFSCDFHNLLSFCLRCTPPQHA